MTTEATIEDKIQELCAAICADDEVCSARASAEAFFADDAAVSLYREMSLLGRALHQKQHQDEEPTAKELSDFEALQERCNAHAGVTAFVEAQQILQGIAETVNGYVTKTLEKGRVPTEKEVWGNGGGGCGEGCGCH